LTIRSRELEVVLEDCLKHTMIAVIIFVLEVRIFNMYPLLKSTAAEQICEVFSLLSQCRRL